MSRLLILAAAIWSGIAAAGTLTIRAPVPSTAAPSHMASGCASGFIYAVEGSQICRRGVQPWRCGDDAAAALRHLIDGRSWRARVGIWIATGAPSHSTASTVRTSVL